MLSFVFLSKNVSNGFQVARAMRGFISWGAVGMGEAKNAGIAGTALHGARHAHSIAERRISVQQFPGEFLDISGVSSVFTL